MVNWGESETAEQIFEPTGTDGVKHAYILETSRGPEPVKYYVIVFCGLEPTPPVGEDYLAEEPLTIGCITQELGRAFANLGIDLVYANAFASPIVAKADLLAIHEIWFHMSDSDKRTLALLSPRLHSAIQLMAPPPEEQNGDSQDSEHQTTTEEKDKEERDEPVEHVYPEEKWDTLEPGEHDPSNLAHAVNCQQCYNKIPNGVRPHVLTRKED
jgi:hypothetical protein